MKRKKEYKDHQIKTARIFQVAVFVLLFTFTGVSALLAAGDGTILRRSSGEICEGCHRTNTNTPSPGESGYEQNNWDSAIKMHSSEIAGDCSNATYKTKTSCVSNAGVWTPGKWVGNNGWGVAGGQYGVFTCTTCHTSHDTTNIYLIKQDITAPSGSLPGGTVDFRYLTGTPGSAPYAMGDDSENHTSSTRICEVCHTTTSYHRYNATAQSNKNHNNAANCTTCHLHTTGFIFAGGACNTCHGASGSTGAPLITSDLVQGANATGSIYPGKHQKHAVDLGYACDTCHTSYSMPDNNNHSIDIGFSALSISGGSYDGQSNVNYTAHNGSTVTNNGTITCSSIYCHSTGQSTTDGNSATPVYASPQWEGTVTCGDCHKVTEASGLTSGSHGSHLGTVGVNGCADCHTGVANDASSYNSANHINATIDVTGSYNKGGVPGNGYGECSTAICHDNGTGTLVSTPTWGTNAAACTACHDAAPTTGSHTAHLSANANCGNCHNDAVQSTTAPTGDHLDANIDVKDVIDGDLGYPINKAKGSAYATCSTASCHDNGTGATPTLVTTPTWGNTSACAECHAAAPATGSHAIHLSSGANCGNCHNDAVQGTTAPTGDHRDNNIDVKDAVNGDLGYPANKTRGSAFTTCTTASCHDNGTGTLVTTPAWGTTTACTACHDAAPATGSHAIHLSSGANCGNCHNDAVQGTTAPTGDHRDNNIDVKDAVNGDLGYPANKAKNTAYTTCSTASCHDNGTGATPTLVTTPTWGNTSACAECHDAAPATGSHSAHLSATVKVNGVSIVCGNCHNDAIQGTTAPTGDHRDNNIDVKDSVDGDLGYPANKSRGSAYTTCSTASCHTNGQNSGGTAVTQKTTATWGVSASCDTCHDFNGSNQPTSGSHTSHLTRTGGTCVQCHNVYGNGSEPDLNSPVHINNIINVSAGGTYTVGGTVAFSYNGSDAHPGNHAPAMGYGTCSSVSCHGGGATRVWGLVGNSCSDCHSNLGGLTGGDRGHAIHVQTAYVGEVSALDYGNFTGNRWYAYSNTGGTPDMGCGLCHPQSSATHNNGIVDLNFNLADVGASGTMKAKNNATQTYAQTQRVSVTCSSVYCHSDGAGTYKTSPEWYAGNFIGDKCDDCHANSPASSSHGKHVVGIHYQGIYTGTTGLATAGTGNTNSHGNTSYSSTINCNVCHNNTVTASANDKNTICLTCHNGTNATLQGNMAIAAASTTHVNGTPDVAFGAINVKSKAQVRDDIATVTDLSQSWSRTSGYKAAGSYDNANTALNTASMYDIAGRTCSAVACHNGNSVTWGATGIGCKNCHTGMPK